MVMPRSLNEPVGFMPFDLEVHVRAGEPAEQRCGNQRGAALPQRDHAVLDMTGQAIAVLRDHPPPLVRHLCSFDSQYRQDCLDDAEAPQRRDGRRERGLARRVRDHEQVGVRAARGRLPDRLDRHAVRGERLRHLGQHAGPVGHPQPHLVAGDRVGDAQHRAGRRTGTPGARARRARGAGRSSRRRR